MPGPLCHLFAVFCLCSTAISASGSENGLQSDSLFVVGQIAEAPDSLMSETTLQVELGEFRLSQGDSLAAATARGTNISGWARGPLGRLQFEFSLPKYADSCGFWLACDTLGLTVVLASDTSRLFWSAEQSGCFPLTSSQAFDDILEEALRLPFESSRLTLIVNWLQGKCASTDQIGRLAAAFDDEARRLKVIQSATCATPANIPQLEPLFVSQHYRSAFTEWAPSID
ncbi:DUF4476 domain-containing protein [bacterium]|nr:DUF4476 domain-containing protein [bacterium]